MTITSIKYTSPVTGTSTRVPTYVRGGTQVQGDETLLVADMTSRELMEAILIELKKISLLLQEETRQPLNDEDIE